MTAAIREPLVGTRLSELARCPRMCSLRALGCPASEPDPLWRRYLARGNLYEAYVTEQFRQKYGADQIERQRIIEWPLGEGHADIYIPKERLLVEVVSTVAPYSIIPDKIRQAQLYLRFDPDAKAAAVYEVNPSDLERERLLPVLLNDETRDLMDDLVAQVQRAVDTNGDDLPPCVCDSPQACHFKGCPFTERAWEGWEMPPTLRLDDAQAELAAELYAADQRVRRMKDAEAEAVEARDELRAQLAPFLVAGREYHGDGLRVKRTECAGRVSYDTSAAFAAGVVDESMLAPFQRVGNGYDRWTVKPEGGSA